MKRIGEKIFDFFKKKKQDSFNLKKNQSKRISWLLGFAALGVLLMFVGNFSSKPKTPAGNEGVSPAKNQVENTGVSIASGMTAEEAQLADKACRLLTQIQGAGKVEVSVRFSSSAQSDYAVNTMTGQKTTQEKDQSGGTRVLTETTKNGQLVLIRENDGTEIPVVEKKSAPQIAGVLVVAQGAEDPEIKARLFEATRVALGIEAHKILVMPKKEG